MKCNECIATSGCMTICHSRAGSGLIKFYSLLVTVDGCWGREG